MLCTFLRFLYDTSKSVKVVFFILKMYKKFSRTTAGVTLRDQVCGPVYCLNDENHQDRMLRYYTTQ